jgi:hypothetical protein
MVVYDQWQQTGDQALLDQIGAYNEADCRSLLACREWLLSLRPPEVSWFGTADSADADATVVDPAKAAKRKEADERNAALVKALTEGVLETEREWRELAGRLARDRLHAEMDFHTTLEAKEDIERLQRDIARIEIHKLDKILAKLEEVIDVVVHCK